MSDDARLKSLRRRVEADPTSIAFAQLAEECRRVGRLEEAADVCRAGLAHHPSFLSARVTLSRTLIQMGDLDGAASELLQVIRAAPDNLAALRGLADIHMRRGEVDQALQHYRTALELAGRDADFEQLAKDMARQVDQPRPARAQDVAELDATLALPGEGLPWTAAPEKDQDPTRRALSELQRWLATIEDERHRRGF